jgi:hypothetical protein
VAGATVVVAGPQAARSMPVTTTSDISNSVERFTISLLFILWITFGWVWVEIEKLYQDLAPPLSRSKEHYTSFWINSNLLVWVS